MSETTTTTDGAEPSSTTAPASTEAPAVNPQPDAAHTPPATESPATATEPSKADPPDEPKGPAVTLSANPSLDEIIASIPDETIANLSAADFEALAAGDPKVVARVLNLPEQAQEKPQTAAEAPKPKAAESPKPPATQPEPEKGIERISLRGLSVRDQKAIADAIQAVKDGKFSSFEEARAAIAPKSEAEAAKPETTTSQPETSPKVEELKQKVASIESQQEEAATKYDTVALLKLNRELVDAKLELRDAEVAWKQEQSNAKSWAEQEQQAMAKAQETFAKEYGDPVFIKALQDAYDLAEYRKDPILDQPDWMEKLTLRLKETFKPASPAAPAQFPTPPPKQEQVRGALETSTHNGTPIMSPQEALDQLDNMSEEQVDAVINRINLIERSKASR